MTGTYEYVVSAGEGTLVKHGRGDFQTLMGVLVLAALNGHTAMFEQVDL